MRNSERSSYRRCRQKWDWLYNGRRQPDRPKGALSFGTLVHTALAEYYVPGRVRGAHPARTFEKEFEKHSRQFEQWDEEGNRFDAVELGVTMLEGYVNEYGKEDYIEIIQPEVPLAVDVYDKKGNYLVTWVGRGDALYRDLLASRKNRDVIRFLEHKTAKSIEDEVSVISGYGEQGLSYWWAGSLVAQHEGLLRPEAMIDGVMFNWLRKGIPDTRPVNEDGHRLNLPKKDALLAACHDRHIEIPKKATIEALTSLLHAAGVDSRLFGEPSSRQPKPLFHRHHLELGSRELAQIARRIRLEAYEMRMAREGKLPIYKNPTKDCRWDCPAKDACEVHEMGGDWEAILDMEFVEWDPYEGHELLEERE